MFFETSDIAILYYPCITGRLKINQARRGKARNVVLECIGSVNAQSIMHRETLKAIMWNSTWYWSINNAEPSQWLQDIYWPLVFFLCYRIDFRLWLVTSTFVGSFTLRFCFISTK